MRRLIYLIATTIDGRIADDDGSADAFGTDPATLAAIFDEYPETCPAHVREAMGVTAPARWFDAVIMGMRTYEPALRAGLTSAYPHLDQHVVTHRRDLPIDASITVVHDDPAGHVQRLKRQPGSGIWLCGGADLAAQLVDEIDEVHVKINPLLLGDGVPLMRAIPALVRMRLTDVRRLGSDVILARYRRAED